MWDKIVTTFFLLYILLGYNSIELNFIFLKLHRLGISYLEKNIWLDLMTYSQKIIIFIEYIYTKQHQFL